MFCIDTIEAGFKNVHVFRTEQTYSVLAICILGIEMAKDIVFLFLSTFRNLVLDIY